LARNSGRVVGRAEIAEHVWDEEFDPFSNLIEVYVNRIRRKIDAPPNKPLLHTRRGAGYLLSTEAEPTTSAHETRHSAKKSHASFSSCPLASLARRSSRLRSADSRRSNNFPPAAEFVASNRQFSGRCGQRVSRDRAGRTARP